MGSSLAGRPENRSWARLWMKKLNLVATLPRLDSISLQGSQTKPNHNTLEKVQNICVSWRVSACAHLVKKMVASASVL